MRLSLMVSPRISLILVNAQYARVFCSYHPYCRGELDQATRHQHQRKSRPSLLLFHTSSWQNVSNKDVHGPPILLPDATYKYKADISVDGVAGEDIAAFVNGLENEKITGVEPESGWIFEKVNCV
jgi:hypothetical protein